MRLLLGLAFVGFVGCGKPETKPPTVPSKPGTPPISRPGDPGPGFPPNIVEKQQFMIFHNLKRCWHNVPDIAWDDTLAARASAHAAKCTLKPESGRSGDGESVTFGVGLDLIKALDNWYLQGIFFPYGAANAPDNMREYAQMLWASSRSLGCAAAKCGNQNYYVCRYSPAGNTKGEAAKNVFKLKPDFATCTGLPRI